MLLVEYWTQVLILWDVLTRTRIGVNAMFLFDACLSCYHLITVVVVDFAVAAVVAIVIIVFFLFLHVIVVVPAAPKGTYKYDQLKYTGCCYSHCTLNRQQIK